MNYPRSKRGVSEEHDENCPKGVIPEFFYRGVQFGIRLDSRLKHAGMTVFGKEIGLTQQAAGNWTAGIKLDSWQHSPGQLIYRKLSTR